MSDHKRSIVPLEAWAYASPDVKLKGCDIDLGLLAEALIYYGSVAVQPTNQPQFAAFLAWFVNGDAFDDLLALLQERALIIYEYSFLTTVIKHPDGEYSLWNVQDPVQEKSNTFEERYLYHPTVEAVLPRQRQRAQLYAACRDRVIEAKAANFGNPINASLDDYRDPDRNSLLIQAFVDELYSVRDLRKPPELKATVVSDDRGHHINWGIDLNGLGQTAGPELNFHPGTPLIAAAHANRLLWSASQLSADLYLSQPMAAVVGDKLYEAAHRVVKSNEVIGELKAEVEFPDVRKLVNDGTIGVKEVLALRAKAVKFRSWLQQESHRDRNAIIAYHQEVAKEAGMITAGRRALSIFGVLGGGLAGAYLAGSVSGAAVGAMAGSGARAATKYLFDLVGKFGENWRPVVFGNWMRFRIEKYVRERELNSGEQKPKEEEGL